jgi:acetoin utilization deacetylase AcuC-like enzyme
MLTNRYNYRGLIERVAIVDFDVHYGDGTAAVVQNLVPGASAYVSIRQHTSAYVSICQHTLAYDGTAAVVRNLVPGVSVFVLLY